MITQVSFVGIVVSDIEAAQRLYTGLLGLKPWDRGIVDMPGVRALILEPPGGGCSIELLQPTAGPDAPAGGDLARRLQKRGESVCRLGVWVDDLNEEVNRLRRQGVALVDTGAYGGAGEDMGARMAFVHPKAAHGVLIELDQRT